MITYLDAAVVFKRELGKDLNPLLLNVEHEFVHESVRETEHMVHFYKTTSSELGKLEDYVVEHGDDCFMLEIELETGTEYEFGWYKSKEFVVKGVNTLVVK